MNDKIRDLVNKLKALSESDNPHESKSAEDKLKKILDKYNIDESILDEDELHFYKFYFHNEYERKLLMQILYKILGDNFIEHIYKKPKQRIVYEIRCTYSQSIEINIQYDFYKELLLEEMNILTNAFIMKHNIYPPKSNREGRHLSESEEMRAAMMSMTLSDKSLTQRIEEKR